MASDFDNQQVLMPQKKRRIAPAVAVLGVLGTGGLGYAVWNQHGQLAVAQSDRDRVSGEKKQLQDALDLHRASSVDLEGQFNTCKDELTTEKTSAAAADLKVAALETEITACKASVTDLEKQKAEVKRRADELKDLTGRFQKMIDTGKLAVTFRRGNMVVNLPAAILFPSGSADISDEGRVALGEVAVVLKQVKGRRFTIAGHTDSDALGKDDKFKSNWQLSTARAVAVAQVLIDKGVSPTQLIAAGYAEYDPIAGNKTNAGKQKNRRIEIMLEPYVSKELANADLPK
jgi:flagellar motor protein MotB